MATPAVLIPVKEYLDTMYRPDCDYLDGELVERNVTEKPHSRIQRRLGTVFDNNMKRWQVEALPEQRVQITSTRFRVPDLCVTALQASDEPIVREAPLLCVEILSREDRMNEVLGRLDDYRSIGVTALWVINPWRREVLVSDARGGLVPAGPLLTLPGTAVQVEVAEVFSALDPLAD